MLQTKKLNIEKIIDSKLNKINKTYESYIKALIVEYEQKINTMIEK